MPKLFLPPKVARELLDERAKYAADVGSACYVDAVCQEWSTELRRLDPLLRLVRAPDCAVPGTPLIAGHYHLIRDNEGAPQSVTPIRGPHGEWCEPPGHLLDQLKMMDLQDARARAMHRREQERVQASHDRAEALRKEHRRDQVRDRVKALRDVRISFDLDQPWSQGVAGKRGARKGSKEA